MVLTEEIRSQSCKGLLLGETGSVVAASSESVHAGMEKDPEVYIRTINWGTLIGEAMFIVLSLLFDLC